MSRKPRAEVDMPVVHLARQYNTFRPPAAKTYEEIARRRALPKGTLRLEFQARGLSIGAGILDRVTEEHDIRFTAGVLSIMANNSAWHTIAEHAQTAGREGVTRRRIKMPKAYDEETQWVRMPSELVTMGRTAVAESAEMAEDLAAAHSEGRPIKQRAWAFGKHLGTTSVLLAGIHQDVAADVVTDPITVQDKLRVAYLYTVDEARTFGLGNRQHPTFAQLAYGDSSVSVYFREKGGLGAGQAYREAVAEVGLAPQ